MKGRLPRDDMAELKASSMVEQGLEFSSLRYDWIAL